MFNIGGNMKYKLKHMKYNDRCTCKHYITIIILCVWRRIFLTNILIELRRDIAWDGIACTRRDDMIWDETRIRKPVCSNNTLHGGHSA